MLLGFPCLFHWLTGWYCPGCGGTRAVTHLLHGDILKSLQYHPLVLYGAIVVVLHLAGWLLAKVRRNPKWVVGLYPLFGYLALGIVVVNCLVKNYMLIVRGIDLLP